MALKEDFSLRVDEHICLKFLNEAEAENLFRLVDQNRSYLRKFLGWLDHNRSVNDSLQFIKEEMEKRVRLEALTLGIYISDELQGLISLYAMDHSNHTTNIGYWISQEKEKQGIMTRSVKTLIDYAFGSLKMHRIEIRCAVHNDSSQKIAQRLGFKREGVLQEAIAHYGQYFDAYIYGLLNSKQ